MLLCGCYWTAAALAALGARLAALLHSWSARAVLYLAPGPAGRLVMVLLLAGLVGSALPKALEPLHISRGGFRAAGLWLAEHAQPTDEVLDPYCWAQYYAGRVFQPGFSTSVPRHPRYVVLDVSGNPHGHLPEQVKAERLAKKGKPVYKGFVGDHKNRAEIVIYALPPE
jgi:hypothetical protein